MHPIFLDLGFIQIRYYGLMYAVALMLAIFFIFKELKWLKIKYVEDDILNIIIYTFIGGIFFARLYYVIFNLNYYLENLSEILAIWHGGLAIHGGIIGAVITGYFLTRHYKVDTWQFADIAAPYVLFGQGLGRFGNFMNGDAHGLPTNLPWGLIFSANTPAGMEFPGIPLHPVMLYELFLNLIFFVFLMRIRLRPHKDGYIFCLYLIFYSIARFFVSFFRADDLMLGSWSVPHVISIVIIAVCWYIIKKFKLNKA